MLILIINEVFKEKGVKTMAFCKNCGNNIPDGATFCSHCGTPVYDTTSQAQTQQHQYGTQHNNFLNSDDVTAEFDPMDIKENKVMAVLAYIGLLVLVPIFAAKDSKYARFHATQGLNITVLSVAQAIIYYILATIISIVFRGSIIFGVGGVLLTILGFINTILSIAFIVLAIYGIVNAVQGKCKKLPIIGKFDILGFINTILSIAFIVLAIYGIVNAVQGKCKKLPIIGKFDILGKFVK